MICERLIRLVIAQIVQKTEGSKPTALIPRLHSLVTFGDLNPLFNLAKCKIKYREMDAT